MNQETNLDPIGIALITIFLLLLTFAGYISYKSIDWSVLNRLESQQLVLPSPASASATSSLSATPSVKPATK